MAEYSTLAVVPARYQAMRLPGKPLAELLGKPMIQWVYEAAREAPGIGHVIVATDDERIACVVRGFGGDARMTDPALPSGTDRVAAIADQVIAQVYVNIQGDEPLMDPRAVGEAARLVHEQGFEMASVMTPLRSMDELHNLAVVKVLVDHAGRAMYFSRYPIPYSRQTEPKPGESFVCRRHVGLYAYRRETLLKIRSLPSSPIERGESLEQLRAMEAGIAIGMSEVDFESIGVDTPDELEKARAALIRRAASTPRPEHGGRAHG